MRREFVKTENMFPSLCVWDDKPESCLNAANGSEASGISVLGRRPSQ